MFPDVPNIFPDVPNTFLDFPTIFPDFPNMFPDVPNIFSDFPNTFRDFSKMFCMFVPCVLNPTCDVAAAQLPASTLKAAATETAAKRSDGVLAAQWTCRALNNGKLISPWENP